MLAQLILSVCNSWKQRRFCLVLKYQHISLSFFYATFYLYLFIFDLIDFLIYLFPDHFRVLFYTRRSIDKRQKTSQRLHVYWYESNEQMATYSSIVSCHSPFLKNYLIMILLHNVFRNHLHVSNHPFMSSRQLCLTESKNLARWPPSNETFIPKTSQSRFPGQLFFHRSSYTVTSESCSRSFLFLINDKF